ncbi:hypothetical protein [Haladaptatus sp. T7]|uniref:WD40/YVTN/BNR-like repeat-containing protein n=1 Tax=Haladaptatus sp. T7 TaxID=2029368 RepID=UPI002230F789|nr:hypothetical protein [Haladaptatus sp. T7]
MAERLYATVSDQLITATQRGDKWTVETALHGKYPRAVVADPKDPDLAFCGTTEDGLWRTTDGGETWSRIGEGIAHERITAVSLDEAKGSEGQSGVWVGTEPTAIYYSKDDGKTWTEKPGLTDLRSEPDWSYPPRPETHHVRWIETDPNDYERVYVSIEQGAFVQSSDCGETWNDRIPGSPRDAHTFALHADAPGRIYAADGLGFIFPGQGYYESVDSGETWGTPNDGLKHQYLWGLAVDPGDPDRVLVSAAESPEAAHVPKISESYIYRRDSDGAWTQCREGLPNAEETCVPVLTTNEDEPGVFYALTDRGIFRSDDTGGTWDRLDIEWEEIASEFPGRRGPNVGPTGLSVV